MASSGSIRGPTPDVCDTKGCNGFYSARELQFAKRHHSAYLPRRQDLVEFDTADRPWPRPGYKLHPDEDGSFASVTSSTPAYPARMLKEPQTSQARAHHIDAITKYSAKSGLQHSSASNASDPDLLHTSQAELAERKATCSTMLRHSPMPRQTMSARHERISPGSTLSSSDITLRKDPGRKPMTSHKQLEFSKNVHKFAHDDRRRRRHRLAPPPEAPLPRSGQWSPAHL